MKEEYVWISNLDLDEKIKFDLIKTFGSIKELYNASLDDLVYFNIKDNIINNLLVIRINHTNNKNFIVIL